MPKNWTQIDIECGGDSAEYLAVELAEAFGVSVEFTAPGVRIYLDAALFGDERRRSLDNIVESARRIFPGEKISGTFSEIPDEDWSETWKAHFKPLRVGRKFLITPTWEKAAPRPDDRVIHIDPGRAFGTGHHETTRLCLEWLEGWVSQNASPGSLLDVGTGSGILAMGAALLGFENIVGIDNDPEAIEVAIPNLELNKVAGKVRVFCAGPQEVEGCFDVVISNIQSLPLIRMSETMVARVKDGGRLVLSGILSEQAEAVSTEYEKQGMTFAGSECAGEWVLLDFEKR